MSVVTFSYQTTFLLLPATITTVTPQATSVMSTMKSPAQRFHQLCNSGMLPKTALPSSGAVPTAKPPPPSAAQKSIILLSDSDDDDNDESSKTTTSAPKAPATTSHQLDLSTTVTNSVGGRPASIQKKVSISKGKKGAATLSKSSKGVQPSLSKVSTTSPGSGIKVCNVKSISLT